jgi:hypothetical protein
VVVPRLVGDEEGGAHTLSNLDIPSTRWSADPGCPAPAEIGATRGASASSVC